MSIFTVLVCQLIINLPGKSCIVCLIYFRAFFLDFPLSSGHFSNIFEYITAKVDCFCRAVKRHHVLLNIIIFLFMGFTPLVRHTLNSADVRMQVISSLLSKSSSRSETNGLFGNDDKE